MCGISGIVQKDSSVKRELIDKMNQKVLHRGPDDHGVFIHHNLGLGHTRLSIFDLSKNGHQPMLDEGMSIVYNGEVFNFLELRRELEKQGVLFHSTSDTEVILKAYRFYGIDFISKLNGMFAIALFDQKINKLFLIRDRYGIKPLYVYQDKNKIIFSSEIKAILSNHELSLSPNSQAITSYLSLLYIPHPHTPYKEIRKVKHASYETIDIGTLQTTITSYYHPNFSKKSHLRESEHLANIDKLLHDSVEKRMLSDVEVGCFLSGGVDSSLLTAFSSKMRTKPIQTFSIGYQGLSDYNDESVYAQTVSKLFDTKHTLVNIDLDISMDNIDEIIYHLDEPNADTSVFLNYFLAKETKKEVSVALSGLGADELFGGYNRYQALLMASRLRSIPSPLRSIFSKMSQNFQTNRSSTFGNINRHISKLLSSIQENDQKTYQQMITYIENEPYLLENIPFDPNDPLFSALKFDQDVYMQDNLLFLSDKMSMAHALEIRVPFLDYRLVDYANSMPSHFKTSFFEKKKILKKLAEAYLPKEIIYRRKQGFAAPIELWLRNMTPEKVITYIDFELLSPYVKKTMIQGTLDAFYRQHKDFALQIYSYIILSSWFRQNKKYFTK